MHGNSPLPLPPKCTGFAHRHRPVQLTAAASLLHCVDSTHDTNQDARHFVADCRTSCRSLVLCFTLIALYIILRRSGSNYVTSE
jgi:hypothetical protein